MRYRSFGWTANGNFYVLFEQIQSGPDVDYPPNIREQVYRRAVEDGLILVMGGDCQ